MPEERELILRHRYPLERLSKARLRSVPSSKAAATIKMSPYELEMLIGELSRTLNHCEAGPDKHELFELCDRLEYVEKYGDGTLDMLM